MKTLVSGVLVLGVLFTVNCSNPKNQNNSTKNKLSVIFDTDANNEMDDQHALAYLLFNGNDFLVKGVTVNTTYNGGNIDQHFAEAERVLKLCMMEGKIPLLKGADHNFEMIEKMLDSAKFDGYEAVSFMINQAKKHTKEKLVIIAVGKLTNVALALKKDPSISNKIRLIWLGSNYPEQGEYNLENDIPAMNFLLNANIHFEMVTVRYGKQTGTDAVRITKQEAPKIMTGLGPKLDVPVTGRHGGLFYNFGDYSVNLFENVEYYGNPPSRALFDMAAVAIVKNPEWAKSSLIPSPIMEDKKWVKRPGNERMIIIWENFNSEEILADFYHSLKNYILVN